ncbi:MAG: 6-O-methylguanine DNA methyltransferase [Planctomycetota bacterium]|nr:MAG: 6-O-methylguanine DNA methyltransferase [Planctomycetota bacterium]
MPASGPTPPTRALPPRDELLAAVAQRDRSYEGVFVLAVVSTGIFCRPGCPARTPRPENCRFFVDARAALLEGFRPCLRCRPLESADAPPEWLAPLLADVEAEPTHRWRDEELRAAGYQPSRVRRWFQRVHGMSFHDYSRARRLGAALGTLQSGGSVTNAGFDAGFESSSGFAEAFRKLAGQAPSRGAASTRVHVTRLSTPLGPLIAGCTDEHLVLLEFADRRGLPAQLATLAKRLGAVFVPGESALLERTGTQVHEWFANTRAEFELPVHAPGTPFQEAVWTALRAIPRGSTVSYGQLAQTLDRPKAVRAVAAANGANRLAILIPCHRVIGADGSLTGYAGGLWRKQRLLELEGLNLTP